MSAPISLYPAAGPSPQPVAAAPAAPVPPRVPVVIRLARTYRAAQIGRLTVGEQIASLRDEFKPVFGSIQVWFNTQNHPAFIYCHPVQWLSLDESLYDWEAQADGVMYGYARTTDAA